MRVSRFHTLKSEPSARPWLQTQCRPGTGSTRSVSQNDSSQESTWDKREEQDFGANWSEAIVMLDLHVHILPGIDDGAADAAVTRQMLERAKQLGFETLVATPHLLEPLSRDYADRVNETLLETQRIAAPLGIKVLPGFEVRITPDLSTRVVQGEPITLAGSRALLIELPGTNWPPFTDDVLFALQVAGFRPILAHPERYTRLRENPSYAIELAQRDIYLQVTIATLAGTFGTKAQRFVQTLVRANAVHIMATDAHSTGRRYEAVPTGLKKLQALSGSQRVRDLTKNVPYQLIHDGVVPDLGINAFAHQVSWKHRFRLSRH